MGGKGGSSGGLDYNDIQSLMRSNPAAEMSQQYFDETAPARTELIGRGTRFSKGDLDYTQSPMYGPGKGAIEDQYEVARQNIIAETPSGGAMSSNMANLEQQRARGMSDLASRISQDDYNKIYGAAFGAPQTSIGGTSGVSSSGVGGAANIASADLAAQAGQSAGKSNMFGQFGQGAGTYFGMKGP